ncbi:MAG: hypothetical protein JWL75_735 [Parcubacteria group bacterium]|nr:hypothetical protein [Parcubacteria group bacterium]
MQRSSRLYREHGLQKSDIVILRELAQQPASTPSFLGQAIHLPRTSIAFRLEKLAERQLCEKKKIRNLSTWSLTPAGIRLLAKSNTEIGTMTLVEGARSFNETLLSLASEVLPARVYVFEPSEQTRLFVKHVDENSYARVSDLIKENDIIVEALFGERSVEYARQLGEGLRRHMYGRPTIGHVLPDNILNFDQLIICFSSDVYLFNYKTLLMTHIKSKEVTQNYRTIFEFYRSFAKSINFNEAIRV